MVDFTGVKALTIPEGDVVKITSGDTVLWEKITSRLPSEYQEVEYIEMTGTQGVLYDEPILDITELVYTFSVSSFTSSYISGTYYQDTSSPVSFMSSRLSGSGKRLDIYFVDNSNHVSSPTLSENTVYTVSIKVDMQKLTCSLNLIQNDTVVTTKTSTFNSFTFTSSYSFGVGCNGYLLQARTEKSLSGKFYSHQHKRNGVIVRDFKPCYRKSDGVIGIYDIVSKTFFTNAGTGNFTKGADV